MTSQYPAAVSFARPSWAVTDSWMARLSVISSSTRLGSIPLAVTALIT